jgi:uncharacterized phiE125 gp8 family phage protein
MDLSQTSPIPGASLPLAAFRDHLRLSSGFADATTQDTLLEQYLRSAIATVEGRTGRALIARDFTLSLTRWRFECGHVLPVAPVSAIGGLTIVSHGGATTTIDPARYALQADGPRPRLVPTGSILPPIPNGGRAVIALTAGFGPDWSDIPADLRQAVFLLAAQSYESRDGGPSNDMAFGVRTLLERWRDLRLGGGA